MEIYYKIKVKNLQKDIPTCSRPSELLTVQMHPNPDQLNRMTQKQQN